LSVYCLHGIKGIAIPTKSFVKIGIKKYFVTTKCLVLSTKRLVAAAKFLVPATKTVPNFVAVTKPLFSVYALTRRYHEIKTKVYLSIKGLPTLTVHNGEAADLETNS